MPARASCYAVSFLELGETIVITNSMGLSGLDENRDGTPTNTN